jgi:Bacterial Ig-like domain (group 3)
VQVTAQDGFGNTDPTFSGNVTVALGANPGGGTLSGTTTITAASGVATFTGLSIDKSGVGYTLTAAATGLTGATSAGFNVTAGAATQLVFTVQPSNATAGTAITPAVRVTALDAQGNTATGFAGTVTITIGTNPDGGTLSGTTSVAAASGIATFSTLSINKSGTGYTLNAAATGLTGAGSAPFNITPGTATALLFVVQPANTPAGAVITPPVQVGARDTQGNIATAFTGNITLAIVTNPASGTLSGTKTVAAVAGVATFSDLSINNAGNGYRLRATSTGLTAVNSTLFNVTTVTPTQLVFTVQPSNTAAGAAITPAVKVTAQDAQGHTATTFTGNVTVAIGTNPGGGTLSGTKTVAAVSGVATFSSLSIDKAGTGYTLTAAAASLTTATSSTFDVSAGGATRVVFVVQPSNTVAGAAIAPAVQVSAQDAQGNTDPSFTGNVTVAIGTNPSGGTLSGTATVAATSGVATFSTLSINKAGTGYTLATTATGLTGTTSAAFNVTAGTAAQLVFTVQPSNTTSGAAVTPAVQVTAQDAQGNTATGFAGNVAVAIANNPSGGSLSGTTSVAAVGGVATFSNLSIDKVGTGYTLAASATGPAGAASAAFNITPGVASRLVFSVQPTTTRAGSVVTPAVQVTAQDAQGNTASGFTGNVTVAIGANPGGGTLSGTTTVAAVSGVATFSTLSIDKAGTGYTLTSSATGPTGATSAAFNIEPAVANRLVFTGQPTNTTAGATITPAVTVTAEDGLGNTVTSFNGSVTVAIGTNPSGGTLSGTATVAATAGVATFSTLSINKAATGYTLTTSATGLAGATSTAFNITAAAASSMALNAGDGQSATAGAAVATPPSVIVHDQFANPVAGVSVTFTVASGNGSVNPTTPVSTGTNGIAAVTWTLGTTAGTNTLTAASSGLSGSPVTFTATGTPGQATKLALTTQPSSSAQGGVALAQQPVVQLQDANGNAVSQSGVTATATVASGPAGATLVNSTTTTGAGGAAAFSGLTINGPTGTYTLSFGATNLTSVTSGSIVLSAASTVTTITGHSPNPSVTGQPVAVTFNVSSDGGTPTGNVTVTDGAASCTGTVAAGTCNLTPTTAGPKTLTASYAGDGNFSGSSSAGVAHTVNPASTTTTVTTHTPNPSTVGESVDITFSVAVNAPGSGTPTGSVTVSDGSLSCSASVATGNCSIIFGTSGGRTLTATYAGDANFAGSTSVGAIQTVNMASTTTTITANTPNPSAVGQAVSFTYTVVANAPGSGTPTGTVTVSDGTQSCSATVGAGSCTIAFTSAGPRSVTASYATDGNYASSTSASVSQSVSAASTTSAITNHTPNPSVVGQGILVSFTVTSSGGTPTGNVTVSDGGATCLGTVASGSCTLTPTTAGPKTLTASYAGDGNFAPSTSPGANHTVNPASTTTTLATGSPDPSVVGQPVNFAFTVVTNAPGSGTPTGTVTVGNTSESCTASVAAGSCSITFASAGPRTITASYPGDGNFASSASSSVSQGVNAASTTTTITSEAPDPSTVGQAYTVNYAVAVTAPGAGTPTGTVTVSDGAVICANTVAAGSCSLASVTPGTKTLTATYGGDANFTTSTSPGVSHTVNLTGTTTTISSATPDPTVAGQPVTVAFTVTSAGGTPTGTVTVGDGTFGCSATVAVGSCQFTPTVVGTRILTATYSGDANFAPSSSSGHAYTVQPAVASQLLFTGQPSNALPLGTISPPVVVTAQDAFGNTVTTFTGAVTIAIGKDGSLLLPAHLSGTLTVAAVSGSASFGDLSIDQIGNGYTLVATSTGFLPVESAPFNISLTP